MSVVVISEQIEVDALVDGHGFDRRLMLVQPALLERVELVRQRHAADLRLHGDQADFAFVQASIARIRSSRL